MSLSVSQLVNNIKAIVDQTDSLKRVEVTGEISNLSKYSSGHWYFTLKDKSARINCVMFSSLNRRVLFSPTDGNKVTIIGDVGIYVGSGQLQIVVTSMKQGGLGDLHARFLELKEKLFKEGYFNPEHKQSLVKYPMQIAVIAGESSAALADILKTLKHRWPIAQVKVFPSLVQGSGAPEQLIFNLKLAERAKVDVIIIARGGGSLEDLWAFNNEELVKAIYNTTTPVVSGVGHEIDTTLVDYVADVRGLTPTAAAQIATPDQYEVYQYLDNVQESLTRLIQHRLQLQRSNLNQLTSSSIIKNPKQLILSRQNRLANIEKSILEKTNSLKAKHQVLETLRNRLLHQSQQFISEQQYILKVKTDTLINRESRVLSNSQQDFRLMVERLNLLSPLTIMSKGYLLSYQEGKLIKSVSEIHTGKPFELKYHDGKLLVQKVEGNNHD